MKRISLLAAVSILLSSQAFAGGPWLKSTAAAQKKAKETNQLIFVDLFADWCGWCHRMEQEVFPSQVFQSATENMVLLRLNTEDQGEGTKFAQQLSVNSLPTFLVVTHDLTIAGIIKGYAPPNQFVQSLAEVQTKYAEFLKKVKAEGTFGKDYQKRLDLAREFTQRSAYSQSEPRLRKLIDDKAVPAAIRDQAYYELGVAQVMQKKYEDAKKTLTAFGKVQTKGEPFERSRLLLGQIYLDQGNLLGAANEFRSFKLSYPNSPLIRNVDMVLPTIERQLAARK